VGNLTDARSQLHAECDTSSIRISSAQRVEPILCSRQHDVSIAPFGHQLRQKLVRQERQVACENQGAGCSGGINCRIETAKGTGAFDAVADDGYPVAGVPGVVGHDQNPIDEGTEEGKLPLENSRGTDPKGGFVAASEAPRTSAREDSRAPHAAIAGVLKGS
jgi:hypothetical protein